MRRLAIAALVLTATAAVARADAPSARLALDQRGSPHAGVPFVLDVVVDGLDESPQPEQPKLEIPGAKVTPLGAEPNVSRSIQIINGRRSDSTRVTWKLKWRVEVDKAGAIHVPPVTVVQGGKRATANGGDLDLDAVPTTDTMKIELALPDRPVFVGESIDVSLSWLFRQQPEDQTFSVPLMNMPEFTVSAPPITDQRRTIQIAAGTKELQLPYTVDQAEVGGVKYNRVTIKFFAAPKQSGKVVVPPASVVAALAVGRADFFGNAPTQLYRALDVPHTFEVKPLPETDRPATFAGAVGTQFAISVGTSRSVVQLGEPVELAITVKSNQRLDTLALGRLDGEGGLPKDRFVVPAESPTGELSDDGKTKTFKVTAQVTGPANEIPALAFSYFDPVRGTYQTIHSDPIAVSVKGGSVVGSSDVVAATPRKPASSGPAEADLALVGADLALSSLGDVDDKPFGGSLMWILIAALYAIPLSVLGVRRWQLRTATQREDAAEVRAAKRRVEQELASAAKTPARDAAGPLAAALRNLARVLEREIDDGGLLAKIETESFAPAAAASPLSAEVRSSAEALVRRWTARAKLPRAQASVAVLVLLALARTANASPDLALSDGRAAHQDAMTVTDASARKAAFSRASTALGEAARALPDRPELLTDWGNAALGAGDVATATLAYRRALGIDGGNVRARRNLAWLRSRQPDSFRPSGSSATDTLFFFHQWPRARRWLVGAVAFGIAVLLIVPWAGRRRRGLTGLAVIPFAVWLAMIASLVLDDRHGDDAVVMDAVVMRAADSAGAPAAMVQPLPRGAEVTVVEHRDAWTKIRLANGNAGWVPDGAVERVQR